MAFDRTPRTCSVSIDATCTGANGRGSTPAMMMPCPAPCAIGGELGGGLLNNLAAMRQEQRGLVPLDPALDDGASNLGLAAASWSDEQHLTVIAAKCLLDLLDGGDLIGAKLDCHVASA